MTAPQASSRLEMLQARFQQKQLQEKEQKLLQLYDQQQQRAYQVVQRGSAGSNSSNHSSTTIKTSTTTTSTSQRGKVRQMFDERRQTTVKGIDRSYPLEPLENKLRKQTNTNNVATQRNGNLTVNRQSVSVKRVARADVNSNVNNGKPVVSYQEEITRESFEPPTHRYNDEDEFGLENRVTTFANGYYRPDADNEEEIALDQETIERNRMMAKIHLMGFDETLKHRVRNDLESEEFPEYLMVDMSDKLPKKNATKKLTQAEARLERFKNANAKRSDMLKQSTSNKRSKQAVPITSNRRSEITGTSSTSAKSGSSRSSERNRAILENLLLVAKTRATNEMNKGQRKSLDIETFNQRDILQNLFRNATKTQSNWKISPRRNEFKSVTSDGRIFIRRSPSPRFFCRETERSGTTMSIDQKSDSSELLFYRDTLTKQNRSPHFFLSESEQSYRTNKSESSYDRGISSTQISPQYLRRESRQSKSTLGTDQNTTESESDWKSEILIKRNTSPQYFDKKIETSLDRKTNSSKLDEEETLNNRTNKPQFFCEESERSATTISLSRENSESKLFETISGKRIISPQYISEKSKQSTTMIKPRSNSTDSTKNILKQRNYDSDDFYKQSVRSSPLINKKISYMRDRYTPSRLKREVRKDLNKNNTSRGVAETRRSPNISDISATSASSIVNLKYGLEFDNIFQSAKPVRKFIKSQNGKIRRLPLKRNINIINIPSVRDNLLKNRYKALSPSREATKSPSIENRKKTTFEAPRKSITPTEVDMEIQEITMTDHRIEYDKVRKTPTPISKRQIDEIYTKSPGNKVKSKFFLTYPVNKTRRQRASILESNAFKSKASTFEKNKKSKDQKDQEKEESAISLSKLDCSSKSESPQHIVTYDPTRLYSSSAEKNKSKIPETREQRWNQTIKNQSKERKNRQHEDTRYPKQMRNQFTENKARSLKAGSYDSLKKRTDSGDTVSPILSDSKNRIEETRTKFRQSQRLRSAQLIQDALKNKNPVIANDKYDREKSRNENKNVAADEIDAEIDVNYQTIVDNASNREIKDHRKITRPNSNDVTTNKDVSFRVTTREPSTKSNTSKKMSFPTKVCSRQRCIKSSIAPRSSLRKIAEISRSADISKVLLSRRIVSKANQSSTSKFLTHTLEHRKRKNVPIATKLTALSPNKINVQYKIEDSEDSARKMSKSLTREKNKFKKDFESINSVGSILKRFDNKGTEFEQLIPIRVSPEISLNITNMQTKTYKPIASKESTVVHKGIDNMTFKSPLKFPVSKDLKVKNVPHKSNIKILGTEMRSSKRLMKTGNLTENQQRSTRSSVCKRLFESDSEKEIQKERSNLNYVKAHNNGYYACSNLKSRNNETVSKVSSFKNFDHKINKKSKKFEEISIFTVKPLQSIKDIRKSIDNEQSKFIITKKSRAVIANRRSTSPESVDVKRLIPATDVVKNTFFLKSDPARMTKVTSYVSRITKSPSPDSAARKQLKSNTRGNAPASPSKSSDIAPKRASANPKNQDAKPSRKSAKDADSIGNRATTAEAIDTTDGVVLQNNTRESTPKSSDIFKQQTASNVSDRPISSVSSNSSANSTQGQISNTKNKMTTRTKTSADNLVACNICERRFARDRISYHEQICVKTTNKKRKKFDTTMFRVKGTELEPFVKKGLSKKQETTKKPEVKSNWRRKHEDFINTIRSAKEYQAAVAKGINPADLPPPPPSDTSDYIQCPHCGRKFNEAAAERHISKCENMLHNKPMHMRAKLRR
ncbi:serine-rich adhesin for platelets isoform X2 [Linepithema humile]|uniref:serine-rich adhesin for platelets isoform X2 n=1 Tax=Linepithema humile TaxID=83485 RepID=UPI000623400A|nr:PREDICTED: uncharacterized protein LOC105670425 isoform X2 [Linepithema humile]